ncbi:MAG: alkaline phosphatase D family protein, partial [Thermoflexibacter sp.]|nr:alkaline phosphatase D family protein [Thermoflexibacter sp.]
MNPKPYLKTLSRRKFIENSVVAATGTLVMPMLFTSCKKEDDFIPQGTYGFLEGIASFDPTQNSIILWTRYTPATNETGTTTIILDVARDANFSTLVASENVRLDANSDNTVRVDVSNLTNNTVYYYRFRNDLTKSTSVVGQTKTLSSSATSVKLAVVSCANFQAGLFNVYGAVADSDADVVIHLGDYIYEYGTNGYGTNSNTAALGRVATPANEILTLEDYRTRYRQYRSDPQLQKAHQLKPFICVWDDHELTNDAYKDGAQNHQPNEGDYNTRKGFALQVWHEYLPARVADKTKIYRNFNFGGLVNLMMLDTRIIGRDKQLDYADYINPTTGTLNTTTFGAAWLNPNRTILGAEQRTWLINQLTTNTATWQVLGSQVLMAKIWVPAELLVLIAQIEASGSVTPALLTRYNAVVTQLATIKARVLAGDPSVTSAERARVETVLPYNLDAWDGYTVERETIFAAARGKRLVALAGDTHNAWHSNLTNASRNKVGVEFATASVSSPGFEALFGTDPVVIGGFQQTNELLIDDLLKSDASRRGFLLVTFNSASASADWRFVSTISTMNTSTTSGFTAVENA